MANLYPTSEQWRQSFVCVYVCICACVVLVNNKIQDLKSFFVLFIDLCEVNTLNRSSQIFNLAKAFGWPRAMMYPFQVVKNWRQNGEFL